MIDPMDSSREKYVVYADDDEDDQLLMKETLSRVFPDCSLLTFGSGFELVSFFREQNVESIAPSLIILDVNMPMWDGLRTLEEIKKIPGFLSIPVMLFTTSINESDRNEAFRLGAIAMVTKPSTYTELEIIITSFKDYL
jgi:CheY-like chemotaxis protein